MPIYVLNYKPTNGVLAPSGYYLQITGSSSSSINVGYNNSDSGPWTSFTGQVVYTPAKTNGGTPANPQPGDGLMLSGVLNQIGPIGPLTLEGTNAFFETNSISTTGYTQLDIGEDDNWTATASVQPPEKD